MRIKIKRFIEDFSDCSRGIPIFRDSQGNTSTKKFQEPIAFSPGT